MGELTTIDSILAFFRDAVENKRVIHPSQWVDEAAKLNVLQEDEDLKLFGLRQAVAIMKVKKLESQEKRNVSEVRMTIEASDEYRMMKQQEAKVERIKEFIRIAKLQGRLTSDSMKGY